MFLEVTLVRRVKYVFLFWIWFCFQHLYREKIGRTAPQDLGMMKYKDLTIWVCVLGET